MRCRIVISISLAVKEETYGSSMLNLLEFKYKNLCKHCICYTVYYSWSCMNEY
jgi:hypothetical protein